MPGTRPTIRCGHRAAIEARAVKARSIAEAASWPFAVLAAVAAAGALVLIHVDRTVFDSDGFAGRADAALQESAVQTAVARRVSDAAIRARPDLLAVRPLLERSAEGIITTPAFRSVVRAAVRDVHRSALDRDAGTVVLTVADTGLLLADAVAQLRPELARRIPPDLTTRLSAISTGEAATGLDVVQQAERVRRARWVAVGAAVVFALLCVLTAPGRRVAARRLGVCAAVAGGLLALLAAAAPVLVTADDALQAVLRVWLEPLVTYGVALAAAGAVVVLAAASVVRRVPVVVTVRRAGAWVVAAPSDDRRRRALRAVVAIGLGGAMVLEPRAALELAVTAAGAVLLLAGAAELLSLAAEPAAERDPAPPRRSRRAAVRIAAAAALVVAGITAAGAVAGDAVTPDAPRTGRCNGHADLCGRPLDHVAFAATHNSMAADREPGWLFVAQDAGIGAQLHDGVRALLIDTHYGFATSRGVATDLTGASKSRVKLTDELGETFVTTALRLRERIGYNGAGRRAVFLCHGFCEVGATDAVAALTGVHRFLVEHPEEVLVLSIEDDTSAADTADVIRRSGLINEVYQGPARPPWPTLGELVARDERVLVLAEQHGADGPSWMHPQPAVAQETPYAFPDAAALQAPAACAPNRGGTAGSLLLVNHWVDTTPAPRTANARTVNATGFLDKRLADCRRRRGLLPNLVAVDFYRQGDVFAAVDRLNATG
jgi:hypothetical protein